MPYMYKYTGVIPYLKTVKVQQTNVKHGVCDTQEMQIAVGNTESCTKHQSQL